MQNKREQKERHATNADEYLITMAIVLALREIV